MRKGFTLMEVILAIGILLVISLAVLSMFTHAISASRRSQHKTVAVWLCQEKMEETLSIKDIENIKNDEGSFFAPFSDYRYKVESGNFEDSLNLKRIVVTVETIEGAKTFLIALKPF